MQAMAALTGLMEHLVQQEVFVQQELASQTLVTELPNAVIILTLLVAAITSVALDIAAGIPIQLAVKTSLVLE